MTRHTCSGDPLIAVAYIRVSKDEQRLGTEAQRAAIRAWAALARARIVALHVDQGVCSVAPVDKRRALSAALASVRRHGAGAFVVARRDRIARDVMLAAAVERAVLNAGARVVSADGVGNGDTPADGFMRAIINDTARLRGGRLR